MKKLLLSLLSVCFILGTFHLQAQNNDLQERYEWLSAFADPNDCTTETVEEYESFVGYKYLLITFADGSQQLYNAEGTFYCQNANNYDCVAAYRLNGPTATWTCADAQTAEDDLIRRLQNSGTRCYSITSISKFEYEGNTYYQPNAGITLRDILVNGPAPCGVLESFPSLYDAEGRRVCDFGIIAPPCSIPRSQGTVVWANEDASCGVEDPFSVGVIQRSINEDRYILQGNDTCKYVKDIIQFDYNGFTFFRINEAQYNPSSCQSAVSSRFYSCTGDFVGGVGNAPSCQNSIVCESLDFNSSFGEVIWAFEENQNSCSITLSSRNCRRIGIYDESDNLLTILDPGIVPAIMVPLETWEDPVPLADGTTRTYIFKEGDFILGSQTASCDNTNIEVTFSPYPSGCSDAAGVQIVTNTGCRDLNVFGTSGNLIGSTTPGGTLSLGPTSKTIYILMAGSDTLSVTFVSGFMERDVNTGGCNIDVCDTQDPLFLPVLQTAINIPPRVNSDGSICWYIKHIIEFQYQGKNYYRVVEDANPSQACRVEWGTLFYTCEGELIGGTGIYPECDDAAVCVYDIPTLNAAANASGTIIWDSGIGNSNDAIFQDYPWLSDLVNPNSCSAEEVEVFQSGIYTYLLVTNANGEETLYNQNGQFYCQNSTSYDCIAAYNLGSPIDSWTCTDTPSGNCLTDEQLLQTFRALYSDECFELINVGLIEYNGQRYFRPSGGFTPFTPVTPCPRGAVVGIIYDCEGNEVCTADNSPLCNALYQQELQVFWTNPENANCSCTDQYLPVCGVDGRTYRNACFAACAGVAITSESDCNLSTSTCSITITNNECRLVGIYDEADNLLTQIGGADPGPGSFRPASTWTDDRPLTANETRTYIFKDGNLEIGRQTATCNMPNIAVVSRYFSGCTDAVGSDFLVNIGCRDLQLFDTRGNLLESAAPGETLFYQRLDRIYILMAGMDTLATGVSVGGGNIDTGGCEEGNNNDQIFEDYSWLNDLGNPTTCILKEVEVWRSGIYTYLLVTDDKGSATLYNENGQFYCQNSANYDCIAAYNLNERVGQWICESNTANDCLITITNEECWYIQVHDVNDNRLEVLRPVNNNSSVWEDPRPLAVGESRLYDFKINEFLVGRVSAACSSPNIKVLNSYADGCAEPAGSSELTNVGCRLLRVTNTLGSLVGRAFPGETITLEDNGELYIIMADHIPLDVETNFGVQDIDTGGCPDDTDYNNVQIFQDYPWLTGIVDRNNCSKERVEVWQARTTVYLWVEDENGDGTLYTENGQVQCRPTPSFPINCFQAYELTDVISVWVCGGVILPEEMEEETSNPAIFNEYTWLSTLIDETKCSNEKVAVYQSGSYSYLLVTNAAGEATLYNQDGQFYCQNASNYDCVAAYNLSAPTDIWTCGGTPPPTLASCNIYSNVPSGTDLCDACYKDISVYEFRGESYIVYRAQTPDCRELEIQVVNCASNIGYCVTGPNIGLDGNCPTFWAEATLVETLWTDADCSNSSEGDCAEGSTAFEGTIIENECGTYILTTDNQYFTIGTSIPVGTTISFNFIYITTVDGVCSTGQPNALFGEISCLEIISEPSNCQNTGTIFFDNCDDGRIFYFVELDDGRIFDPYFDEGIDFTPIDGQRIKFDFVDANFSSPCSNPEKAIIITCVEQIVDNSLGPIFSDFPWLSDIVNPTSCKGETVTVYQSGGFKYLHIVSTNGSALYFQDGTFYCMDAPNYNCVNAYKLSEVIDIWNCADLLPESEERRSDQVLETSFFTISPNPTTDRFTIQLPEVSEKDYQVQVVDMLGRIVHQTQLPARTTATTIDLADYQNGIYYVELRAAGIRSVKKVVKQGLE